MVPPENKFEHLIQELSDVLGPTSGIDSDDVDEQDLINLMNSYSSAEKEWFRYALNDSSRNYTRNRESSGAFLSQLALLQLSRRAIEMTSIAAMMLTYGN